MPSTKFRGFFNVKKLSAAILILGMRQEMTSLLAKWQKDASVKWTYSFLRYHPPPSFLNKSIHNHVILNELFSQHRRHYCGTRCWARCWAELRLDCRSHGQWACTSSKVRVSLLLLHQSLPLSVWSWGLKGHRLSRAFTLLVRHSTALSVSLSPPFSPSVHHFQLSHFHFQKCIMNCSLILENVRKGVWERKIDRTSVRRKEENGRRVKQNQG